VRAGILPGLQGQTFQSKVRVKEELMGSAYDDRVVLFMDILGFRDLIRRERQDVVAEALAAIAVQYKENIQISAFSDNVAVSMIVAGGCELLQIIQVSSYLSWLLLHKGVLSRGGIAIGKLHHDNGIIFGPALNDAYELESQVAVYPRIILQHEVITKFLQIHGDNKCVCENSIRQQLRLDFDGWYFVHIMGHPATIPIDEMLPPTARSPQGEVSHQELTQISH
jgi:hypothetical protein